MPAITPDRGHPVAQQLVLGSFTVLAIITLLLVALPPAWFSPPSWVWLLLEDALIGLGWIYARVWLWPRRG